MELLKILLSVLAVAASAFAGDTEQRDNSFAFTKQNSFNQLDKTEKQTDNSAAYSLGSAQGYQFASSTGSNEFTRGASTSQTAQNQGDKSTGYSFGGDQGYQQSPQASAATQYYSTVGQLGGYNFGQTYQNPTGLTNGVSEINAYRAAATPQRDFVPIHEPQQERPQATPAAQPQYLEATQPQYQTYNPQVLYNHNQFPQSFQFVSSNSAPGRSPKYYNIQTSTVPGYNFQTGYQQHGGYLQFQQPQGLGYGASAGYTIPAGYGYTMNPGYQHPQIYNAHGYTQPTVAPVNYPSSFTNGYKSGFVPSGYRFGKTFGVASPKIQGSTFSGYRAGKALELNGFGGSQYFEGYKSAPLRYQASPEYRSLPQQQQQQKQQQEQQAPKQESSMDTIKDLISRGLVNIPNGFRILPTNDDKAIYLIGKPGMIPM